MAIKTVTELKEYWLMLMRKALRGTGSKRAVKGNPTEPARLQPERGNYGGTDGRAEPGWSQRLDRQVGPWEMMTQVKLRK